MTDEATPAVVRKWENPDAALTVKECGDFFRDSFEYSRGTPPVQRLFFRYALLQRPHWAGVIMNMDGVKVKAAALKQVKAMIRVGGHVDLGKDEMRDISNGEWKNLHSESIHALNRLTPIRTKQEVLSKLVENYILYDYDYISGSHDHKLKRQGRVLHDSGFRKLHRSFLYDHAVRNVPLRGDTHPVFKEMFADIRTFIESPEFEKIDPTKLILWKEIVKLSAPKEQEVSGEGE